MNIRTEETVSRREIDFYRVTFPFLIVLLVICFALLGQEVKVPDSQASHTIDAVQG